MRLVLFLAAVCAIQRPLSSDRLEPVLVLEGHDAAVLSVAVSPDGRTFATGANNNQVRFWRAGDGEPLETWPGHEGAVTGIRFTPDSRKAAAGSWGAKLLILRDRQPSHTLEAHTGFITSLDISPDGETIVTGSIDSTAKLWSVASGDELATFTHPGVVETVAFLKKGKQVALGGGERTVIWDVALRRSVQVIKSHEPEVQGVSWHEATGLLATCGKDRKAKLWKGDPFVEEAALEGAPEELTSIAFSADGKWVAAGCADKNAYVWSAKGGSPKWTLTGAEARINSVAFHPEKSLVVGGSSDRRAYVWELPKAR